MPEPQVDPSTVVQPFPATARPRKGVKIDPLAEAGFAQAAALNRIAAMGEKAIETFGPAAEAIASLGEAQKRLCAFLVGHRLKIFGSIPVVLVAIGAISPNAAHVLQGLLQAFGVR